MSRAHASARDVLARQAAWAAGALWLAVVGWGFLNGPRLQAEQEREIAREAEAENVSVCLRFGLPPGSPGYPACARELEEVRRHDRDRLERHATRVP